MNARRRGGRPPKRRSRLLLALLGALAVVAVILVVVLIVNLLRPGAPGLPGGPGPSSAPPRAQSQPADCPDVETLVVPGTWESSPTDDPMNPTAKPAALLKRVSTPLSEQFRSSRDKVYTVPYLAEFRNPTNLGDHQADYDVSRGQGYRRAVDELSRTNKNCPLTRYVLLGFSQGAVIAGDVASNIGNGRGVLGEGDQDLVLGVGLIADGRRQPGQQRDITPSPPGVGAEVALGGMGGIVPGSTMTGARAGGFGALRDRVVSICAPNDLICDAPQATNPLGAVSQLAGAINNPVHAMYATTKYWSHDGTTATQWLYGWARKAVADAPHPAH